MSSPKEPKKVIREELTDGRIRLRRHCPEDVDALFEAVRESIPEISPWLAFCTEQYSREESEQWIGSRARAWEAGEDYSFAIEDVDGSTFLGGCDINQIDRNNLRANLGYWIRSSHSGRGIVTAAVRLLAGFGFEDLGLMRIEIVAAPGNKASQRVAEKAGAFREGVLRKRIRVRDIFYDAVSYSLLPEDFHQKPG